MLFIAGVVMALIASVIISRIRVPGSVNSATLGWMSEQWLAEHRVSHSP
jgi:hypothetical protein